MARTVHRQRASAAGLPAPAARVPIPRGVAAWLAVFPYLVLAGCAALILAALAIQAVFGIPVSELTRDPATVAAVPAYTGAISYVGIVLWCCAASVCIFSAVILWHQGAERRLTLFLLLGGVATAYLMLDDLLLLHEVVYPKLFRTETIDVINRTDAPIYLVYLAVAVAFFWRFRSVLSHTPSHLLIVAVVLFALSGVADSLSDLIGADRSPRSRYFPLEDGLKLLGIGLWCSYFIRVCLERMLSATAPTTRG